MFMPSLIKFIIGRSVFSYDFIEAVGWARCRMLNVPDVRKFIKFTNSLNVLKVKLKLFGRIELGTLSPTKVERVLTLFIWCT